MAGRALRLLGVASGMVVVLTILLGIVYPLAMTGAAQALFPDKADGSLEFIGEDTLPPGNKDLRRGPGR